jgi:hypothetical protein
MNGEGIVIPRIVGSKDGKIRSAPSSQPTYQSGWAGELTTAASNGPNSQTGLIWKRRPSSATIAAVRKNRPLDRNAWLGQNAAPDDVVLAGRAAAVLGVLLQERAGRCGRDQGDHQPGSSMMWST